MTIEGQEAPVDISPEALSEWVSVAENPGNRRSVSFVDVGVPTGLLQGLVLVDTPGAGGLDASHARITMTAVQQADALVFVLDAAAPLSRPELAFLQEASERIDRVLLVLTKRDLFPGWPAVLDEDRRLLQEYAPRFSDLSIHPIGRWWRTAGSRPCVAATTSAAGGCSSRAGCCSCAASSKALVAQGETLRAANGMRAAGAVVRALDAACVEQLASPERRPSAPRRHEAGAGPASRQLNAVNEDWRDATTQRFVDAQRRLNKTLQSRLDGFRDERQAVISSWKPQEKATFAEDNENGLRSLAAELEVTVSDTVRACVLDSAEAIGVEPWKLEIEAQLTRDREVHEPAPATVGGPNTRLALGQTIMQIVMGISLGSPVTALLAPFGLGQSLVASRQHRQVAEQQEARRALAETLQKLSRECAGAIDETVRSAQTQTVRLVRAAIKTELAAVRSRIESLTSAVAGVMDSEQRRAQLEGERDRLATLGATAASRVP